jgi:hypothetical protein
MPLTPERETELRQHFRVWAYLAPFDREEAEFFARLWIEHVHWEHGGADGYNQFRQKIAAYDNAAARLEADESNVVPLLAKRIPPVGAALTALGAAKVMIGDLLAFPLSVLA